MIAPEAGTSALRRGLPGGLLVATTAILAYAWAAGLAFQIDDYWIIPTSGRQLRQFAGLITDPAALAGGAGAPLPEPAVPLFQPVLWALHRAEAAASGETLSPAVFHTVSVLLHGVAGVLLWRLLRCWLGSRAALWGGLFFALHPAGAQAVTWVAARGLVLITIFGLAAMLAIERVRETGRRRSSLAAGGWLALGFCSQVAAVGLVPVVLATLVLRRHAAARRPLLVHAALILAPVAVAVLLRRSYVGTWSLSYLGGTSAEPAAFPRMLAAIPGLLGHLAAPWIGHPQAADLRSLAQVAGLPPAVVAGPWIVLLLAAVGSEPARTLPRLFSSALALAGLAAPALFLWSLYDDLDDARVSRALYPACAALGGLVAAGMAPAAPGRGLRIARGLALAALLAIAGDALVHVARVEHRAASLIGGRTAGIAAEAAGLAAPSLVAVVDPYVTFAGVPLISPKHVPASMTPPFHAPPVAATCAPDLGQLLEDGTLVRRPETLSVLEWQDGRYVPLARSLPPIPERLPALVAAPASLPGVAAWTPEVPIPPRSVAAVRVPLAAATGAHVEVLVVSDRAQLLHPVEATPGETEAIIGLDMQQGWLFGRELRSIAVRGAGDGAAPPVLLPAIPALPAPVAPPEGARLPVDAVPAFILRGVPPEAEIRFLFRVAVGDASFRMIYRVPASALHALPDGSRTWHPRPEEFEFSTHPGLRWHLAAGYFREKLRPYGIRELRVEWRAALLYRGGVTERARTGWSSFVLAGDR